MSKTSENPSPQKFTCQVTDCSKSYNKIGSLQFHMSSEHNAKTTVMYNGVSTVFERNQTSGKFHCKSPCAFEAVSSRTLKSHCESHHAEIAKSGEKQNSTSKGMEPKSSKAKATIVKPPVVTLPFWKPLSTPAESEKEKRYAQFLQSIGFRLDNTHKILICISCEYAVIPDNIRGHLLGQHAVQHNKIQTKVDELQEYYGIHKTTLVPVPEPGSLAVEGIKVSDEGLACPECSYVCLKEKMWQKPAATHPNKPEFVRCKAQAFFHGVGVRYFSVTVPEAQIDPGDKYQHFLRKIAPTLPQVSIGKASTIREIPLLVQKTEWDKHLLEWQLNPDRRKEIKELVKPTSKEEIWAKHLSECVQLYMKSIRDVAFSVEYIILRKMMQMSDANVEEGWRVLKNDLTLQLYGSTFAKFLVSLLRSAFVSKIDYKFPLDENQMAFAKQVYTAARNKSDLEEHIHAFSVSLFKRPPPGRHSQKWLCPLTCYLAVDNLRDGGTFTEAHLLTTYLARWEYVIRGVALFEAKNIASNYEDGLEESIEECWKNMLSIDRSCPFNTIFEMQHLASSIAMARVAPPSITWADDFSSLSMKGNVIKIDNIRSGLCEMEELVWTTLDEVTHNQRVPYYVPDDLVDDMTDHTAGYSWLENGNFTSTPHALLELLLKNPKSHLATFKGDNLEWNHTEAYEIMSKLALVNRLLSVLLHIGPSQPARGTEHVDTKIRNSWRLRNLFWQNGKLWIVTQYTKTSNITGHDMFIPMMIPHRLANLLTYYLVVFRPLEMVISTFLFEKDALQNYHDYLYVEMGNRVTSDKFSDHLGALTAKFMKVKLTLNPYRHVAIAIKREFIPAIYHITSTHQDEVGDHSSGHSTAMARRIYATKTGDLPFLTTDAMREFSKFCSLWHNMMGYGTGPIPEPLQLQKSLINSFGGIDMETLRELIYNTVQSAMQGEIKNSLEMILSVIYDKLKLAQQPLNEQSVEEKQVKKRPLDDCEEPIHIAKKPRLEDPEDKPEIIVAKPEACVEEQFPDPEPIQETTEISQRVLAASQFARNTPPEGKRAKQDMEYDPYQVLELLRDCYENWELDFKSDEQLELIQAALNRREDVIAILPTGGGKSAAFEVPAKMEEGLQTIVIVPFKALLKDIMQRVKKLGINVLWWNSGMNWPSPSKASLVLVIYETALSKTFHQTVMEYKKDIARIVFDECHQIFLSADLREKLWKFPKLGVLPFPQIFLTATLPPHLLEEFKNGLGLSPDTRVIRKTTERPEIEYSVLEYNKEKEPSVQEIAVAKALEYTKNFDTNSRGIIFSRSKDGADSVAKKLNCAVSRTGLKPEESQENFDNWKSGKTVWMAATSGFSNGIDYSDVRVVIFMEPPHGMMDLVQGSGRGGRSGLPSKTLLITYWKNTGHDDEPGKHWKCVKKMQEWIDSDRTCRRELISSCMDGLALSCEDIPNALPCDVCSGIRPTWHLIDQPSGLRNESPVRYASPGFSQISTSATPTEGNSRSLEQYAPYERRVKARQSDEQSKEELRDRLSMQVECFAEKYCIVCYVLTGERVLQDHVLLKHCKKSILDNGWKDFKQLCQLPRNYTYCFHCWMPQGQYTPPCHKRNYNTTDPCNLHNLLTLCAWTVCHDKRLWNLAERKYGWKKGITKEEFGAWLAKECRSDKFINAIDLFLFISKCYETARNKNSR